MSHLIMRRGPEPGTIYRLDSDIVTIGRGNKNIIIIRDNEVSRDHLRLQRTEEGYELYDLDSSNGTYVNGHKVDDVWLLNSQCIIELGDSITLEFHPGGDGEVKTAVNGVGSYYLVVVNTRNHDEPAIYPLNTDTIIVGRSTSSDIVVVEPELSREHFRLLLNGDGHYIEDMGSTNGTIVNGEVLTEVRQLFNGDTIQVGEEIQFQFTDSPERYTSGMQTDLLADRKEQTQPRRTLGEIPDVIQAIPEPTGIGTGVDNTSLEEEVLITYIRDDWERIVAPMVDHLYRAGINIWVDQYLMEGSKDWLVATEQARLECWLLVVVVSPAAIRSDIVKKNWRHFQNREKPIILMIHEPVERMPIGAKKLTQIQYNPGIPEVAFQQLVNDIKRLRGQD